MQLSMPEVVSNQACSPFAESHPTNIAAASVYGHLRFAPRRTWKKRQVTKGGDTWERTPSWPATCHCHLLPGAAAARGHAGDSLVRAARVTKATVRSRTCPTRLPHPRRQPAVGPMPCAPCLVAIAPKPPGARTNRVNCPQESRTAPPQAAAGSACIALGQPHLPGPPGVQE